MEYDYPLLPWSNKTEVMYLLNALCARGFVLASGLGYAMLMPGWEHLEKIRQEGHASVRCFVAMSFSEAMNDVYDQAIAPAVAQAGYEPLRLDKLEHSNRIDDEIVGQIKRARFMVADFTEQRAGVYFEAGLMQGIGRTVIWMCRNQELEEGQLHFDVRQFNFIGYDSPAEAKQKLCNRILSVEGEAPLAKK